MSRPVAHDVGLVLDLYRQGLPVRDIASRAGVSVGTVTRDARLAGLTGHRRRGNQPVYDYADIAYRYTVEGKSRAEIARELGCMPRTVTRALRAHGIELVTRYAGGPRRSFDWDECRAAYEVGVPVSELVRRYGRTRRAIVCAIRGRTTGTAECECGVTIDVGALHCKRCAAAATVKRDEHGRLFCASCSTWKDEQEFPANRRRPIRGRRTSCRQCETAKRRARRNANPEATRAYERARRQRERAAVASVTSRC